MRSMMKRWVTALMEIVMGIFVIIFIIFFFPVGFMEDTQLNSIYLVLCSGILLILLGIKIAERRIIHYIKCDKIDD